MMSTLLLSQLLLLSLRAAPMTANLGEPCPDFAPVDLLSTALEKDASGPIAGMHVRSSGGVRGVQFSGPYAPINLPSNCDSTPKDFSVVITLKMTRIARKKSEYIFSMMEQKRAEQGAVEEQEKVEKQDGNNLQIDSRSRVHNNAEHRHLLLGLRLSGKRLHVLFRGQRGATEQRVFQGARLADNRWHTLVLFISGRHARLTVDCGSPWEMPFPSDLNFYVSRFHIGSRGRWKGLFTGLLRQLVLVPGSDATQKICPSNHPQLSALSIPPLLLLSATGRNTGSHLTPYETDERVLVGLERTCSELFRGQMWFNPLRTALYLCDGTSWITVLEDRKRLDYVEEQQVLSTSSETHDIEIFQVQGMGLMAAMAHRSSTSGSAVYQWSQHNGFQLYQNISTQRALAWKHFNMGKKTFLVVSNSDIGTNVGKESDYSVIYKWSRKSKQFVQFQTLQTHCARDWEAFKIHRHTYLVVANHRIGDNNHTIDSVVYKWNRPTKSFEVHQKLRTSGAYDWEFFKVGPYHFLVVANAFDGITTSVDSVIYVWVDGNFRVFQTIKTFCATDWEMFQIGSRVFLVVANGHWLHGNGPGQYAINSTVYELDMTARLFVRFQDIVTYSAVDWEFFSLGEDYFLVVANSFNGESYSLNSVLYRWQGYEGFIPVHFLPTIGCSDWEFFSAGRDSYLIYSSAKVPLAKVFKLKMY
ncbi:thrombospondin-type laminin G domain and EAR repeat-containing protein [Corythoichthys intestinalis]|uniref:thrombospondin-type laminin G domain and EAR repeat-containing protein n=1 Tax=Corythoichthys intestinalis TaxID=161448 RepID=UPI0025A6057B|nr:thrombospondin-type laminin G domain and EAR repeat-containing protein [Corythoichthys intestinalis]XP_057715137.1 thrombospondin-type laminin G domain and EAR repeat-containing protein [Corythoichthys intestinalis]XP_057715138.1 thrombospondin-type laminin G domain and EAR repeat-containing protein [Corythoichthys intestinalis]XP_057715139.1 thrombospondin-type laminin G domain and EAR repeat-containing protein [Corythoichthys intestinalis]